MPLERRLWAVQWVSRDPVWGGLQGFGLGAACLLHQARSQEENWLLLTPFLLDSLAAYVSVVRAFKVPESHRFPYGFEKFFKEERETQKCNSS